MVFLLIPSPSARSSIVTLRKPWARNCSRAAPRIRCRAVRSDGTSGGCTSRRFITDSLAMVLRKRYWYYKFPRESCKAGGGRYDSHEGRRTGGGRLVDAARLLVRAPANRQGGGEGLPPRTGQDCGPPPTVAAGHRADGWRRGGNALGAHQPEAARRPPGGPAPRLPVLNRPQLCRGQSGGAQRAATGRPGRL